MMKRQIVLDTETTGLEPKQGHRIIEIGCVELINRRLTGQHFHVYINPERIVEEEALAVHGISNLFLSDKPVFGQIIDEFIEYVQGAELIIHNAPFDIGFILHEFTLAGVHQPDIRKICTVFDTLKFARSKHPGQKNNLDALCSRYGVNNKNRELHGALLDAEILACVYLAMTGGQTELLIEEHTDKDGAIVLKEPLKKQYKLPVISANADELLAHQQFIEKVLS